jgi:probable HAF family extracellular repeat protein
MYRTLFASFVAALLSFVPATAAAQTIISFDAPGSSATHPGRISPDGKVVGYYEIGIDVHGFMRDTDGSIISLDPPGAINSYAVAFNRAGQIVGTYADSSSVYHGYLWSQAEGFTTFDVASGDTSPTDMNAAGDITGDNFPQAFFRKADGTVTLFSLGISTFALAINSADQIVGQYTDSAGKEHAFLRNSDGTIVNFDLGNGGTSPADINSAGVITGVFYSGKKGIGRGFVRNPDGTVVTFGRADVEATLANAINSIGTVVGWYNDLQGQGHGLLRTAKGKITVIDVPGATFTKLIDINNAGIVVGEYGDALGNHGLIATK